ncbi:MAG: glycosyltransferase [Candidatus Latescibacterota bacterium]|nr:glycosyltransferase [Candidatus Latescibacterota bacterium]
MRILLTSRLYPNSAFPERGSFVHNQARFIAKLCDIEIFSPIPFFPSLPGLGRWSALSRVGKIEEMDGLKIRFPRYISIPKRFLFGQAWRAYLRSLKKNVNIYPDLIHAHLAYPDGLAAVHLGKEIGKPVVISVHGHDIRELPEANSHWCLLISQALCRADAVVVSSQDARERVLKLGVDPRRLYDIPQGVDCSVFVPDVSKCFNKDEWRLLYAGRFDKKKGLAVLIDALKILRSQNRNVTLKLVGASQSGGGDEQFRVQAEQNQVAEWVEFERALPWSEMPSVMASADIFVLPSYYDSFGIVLIESMACGIPVVATKCGGPEQLVDSTVGRLAKIGDPESLANAIGEVIDSYADFDREIIRKHSLPYDYKSIADRIHKMYKKILNV